MKLTLCRQCGRHVKNADASCPFCGSRMPNARLGAAATAALVVGLGVAAAACSGESDTTGTGGTIAAYGPPPDAAADVVDGGQGSSDGDVDGDAANVAMYGPAPYDAEPSPDAVGTAYGPPSP